MINIKKFFAALLVAVVCNFALFANELQYINIDELHNTDSYKNELVFAYNHQSYFGYYVPDEYWDFPYTREECVEKLTKLYNSLLENPEPGNQEYMLCKAVVATYLYNLDEMNYFNIAVNDFLAIENLPSYDYRCPWFLGKFYANATLFERGVEQFNMILDSIPPENVNPDLLLNYGGVLHAAGMPMSAINALELYEKFSGKSVQQNSIYTTIKSRIHEYDGTDTESEMLMRRQVRGEKSGVMLRPFGLWFSIPEEWTVNVSRFLEKMYVLQCYLKAPAHDGTYINYSVLMFSNVADTIEETSAYKQYLSCFERFEKVNQVNLFPDRNDVISVEYTDSSMYADRGGSHGYAVLVIEPWTNTADIDMEVPENYLKNTEGGLQYYSLGNFYKRYKGYAVHFFFVDSCEEIFEEAKEQFVNFINNCKFF